MNNEKNIPYVKIYSLLRELDKLGINNIYKGEKLEYHIYSYNIDEQEGSYIKLSEKCFKFMNDNFIYLKELNERGYIKNIGDKEILNNFIRFSNPENNFFIIISSKGYIFLENNKKYKLWFKDNNLLINIFYKFILSIILIIIPIILTKFL